MVSALWLLWRLSLVQSVFWKQTGLFWHYTRLGGCHWRRWRGLCLSAYLVLEQNVWLGSYLHSFGHFSYLLWWCCKGCFAVKLSNIKHLTDQSAVRRAFVSLPSRLVMCRSPRPRSKPDSLYRALVCPSGVRPSPTFSHRVSFAPSFGVRGHRSGQLQREEPERKWNKQKESKPNKAATRLW